MFPLTEECPKCLLPIANRPLLSFQLDAISSNGINDILVVSPQDFQHQFTQYLAENPRTNMKIDLFFVENNSSSADCLRAVKDKIRGEFFVLGSDTFCQFPLSRLLSYHIASTSDITMLLTTAPYIEPEKKGGNRKIKLEEEDQEFIGICGDGRVVFKHSREGMEERGSSASSSSGEAAETGVLPPIKVPKHLLQKCFSSSLTIRSDLVDVGVYVMSPWVLDLLSNVPNTNTNTNTTSNNTTYTHTPFSSLRHDLLPYLINRQFQPAHRLPPSVPHMNKRLRPLGVIDDWLVRRESSTSASVSLSSSSSSSSSNGYQPLPPMDLTNMLASHLNITFPTRRPNTPNMPLTPQTPDCSPPTILTSSSTLTDVSTSSTNHTHTHTQTHTTHLAGSNPKYPTITKKKSILSYQNLPKPPNEFDQHSDEILMSGACKTGHRHRQDPIRVFGFVLGDNNLSPYLFLSTPLSVSASSASEDGSGGTGTGTGIVERLAGVDSYLSLNRQVPLALSQISPLVGWMRREGSVLSATAQLGEKVVLKGSVVGNNVSVGARSRLTSCVLMGGASSIGENCSLQNTVVCPRASIGKNCSLTDSQVGSGVTIPDGTKAKGESFTN